jgi:hypothetical protein
VEAFEANMKAWQGRPAVKTLFALVLLFDLVALSGAPQTFILRSIKTTEVRLAQSFATDNQTFPDLFDFGSRKHFGLWGWQVCRLRTSGWTQPCLARGWVLPLGPNGAQSVARTRKFHHGTGIVPNAAQNVGGSAATVDFEVSLGAGFSGQDSAGTAVSLMLPPVVIRPILSPFCSAAAGVVAGWTADDMAVPGPRSAAADHTTPAPSGRMRDGRW